MFTKKNQIETEFASTELKMKSLTFLMYTYDKRIECSDSSIILLKLSFNQIRSSSRINKIEDVATKYTALLN